jgi:hypothetical protein
LFDRRHRFNAAELAQLSVRDLSGILDQPHAQPRRKTAQKRDQMTQLLKASPERSNRLTAERS